MPCGNCGGDGHNRKGCLQPPTFVPGVIDVRQGKEAPEELKSNALITLLLKIALEVGEILKKGRMECVYQQAIAHELQLQRIQYTSEEVVPIRYKSTTIGFERMDIYMPESKTVIELKAVSSDIKPEHLWQLVNYMREKDSPVGILINYNQSLNKGVQTEIIHQEENHFYIFSQKDSWLTPMVNYEFA